MTAQMVLDTILSQGIELKAEKGKIFARPRLPENLKAEVKTHKAAIMVLLSPPPDRTLAAAYLRYWTTPESEPMETFQATLAEIATLEAQLDPGKVIGILETEARKFHSATGRCPYCQLEGPLHQGIEGHEGS